ncbi:zinc ABC transporter substrate-binding protein [Pollutimonas sp. H1-120]|uniref:metal ABC transporter solute-binding protein, Zn/Mn family n=1 Tax=Pollutimonas sp. H1-120 TaxID=3148824 RepID=UPI003B52722D
MPRRRVLGTLAGATLAAVMPGAFAARSAAAIAPLNVVASFSILGDMVREIGGERVALTTLVGANGDVHSFEPSPRDTKALSEAAVLVLNGLDFETWLPRLVQSSGFKGRQILASKGVAVRRLSADELGGGDHGDDHGDEPEGHGKKQHGHGDAHAHGDHSVGDIDPHAWQDLRNGMIYAQNIADGLARADPPRASYYKMRAKLYIEKMTKLDAEIRVALADIPANRRIVITSHDAFGYFAQAYGIRFISVAGLSSEAEPSAKDLAAIVDRAKKEHVAGVFIESGTSSRLVKQLARETGIRMGGTLYSDALASADAPAASYLGMFSWNAGRLIYVLTR